MKAQITKLPLLILASVLLVSGITSCDKIRDFGDTNVNPGVTSEPITSALLTNVLAGISGYATSTRGGAYCQYFSETQYTDLSTYSLPQLEFSGNYSGALYDLQNIINYNSDPATADKAKAFGSNNNQIAVARILKAYIYWWITDQWGDIPYSEALKGVQPKYDRQQDIYTDLFKELKEAVAQFDGGDPFKGDILFNGDISRWKKFANSMRLLMALRIIKADAGKAQTEAVAAINDAGGLISSNSDNAVIDYPGGAFLNPWWSLYNGRVDWAMSDVVDGFFDATSDRRALAFGSSSIGFPYGRDRAEAVAFFNANPNWARILAPSYRTEGSPIVLLNYASILLARAEVRERGWITSGQTAAELYNAAIQASWEQWGVFSQTEYNNYIANASVAYGTNNLQKIGIQRWLAHYPDGSQGWAEWRRSGYPALSPAIDATNASGQIPRRYVYGTAEYSLNQSGVEEAVDRLAGGDTQDSRVWWDKQ